MTTTLRGSDRILALIGYAIMATIFCGIWYLNGVFTVRALQMLDIPTGLAWGIHGAVTFLETAMAAALTGMHQAKCNRGAIASAALIFAIAGFVDIGSTAWGFRDWLAHYVPVGYNAGIGISVTVAFFIALSPEPALIALLKATHTTLQGGGDRTRR